jgi:GT2 family glycosyltransferase
VMGCGSGIDYFHMQIFPLRCDQRMDVGALPGRGALFPWKVCLSIGHIRTSLFRHYGADTEYSARARDYGWPIIVSRNARVFSSRKSSDEMVRRRGRIVDMLSFRSKNHLMRRLLFFSIRGPIYLRFWAVPRYISVAGWRWLKGIRRARGRIRDVG